MGDHANVTKYRERLKKEFLSTGYHDYLPIVKFAPIYSREAVRRNLGGYVIVEFTVDLTGKVKDAKVIETRNKIFNRAEL